MTFFFLLVNKKEFNFKIKEIFVITSDECYKIINIT